MTSTSLFRISISFRKYSWIYYFTLMRKWKRDIYLIQNIYRLSNWFQELNIISKNLSTIKSKYTVCKHNCRTLITNIAFILEANGNRQRGFVTYFFLHPRNICLHKQTYIQNKYTEVFGNSKCWRVKGTAIVENVILAPSQITQTYCVDQQ